MPNLARSLTDTYDLFSRWIGETVRDFENERRRETPIESYPITRFLEHATSFVVQRFHYIADMVTEEFKITVKSVTLIEFMEQYCEPRKHSVLVRCKNRLQKKSKVLPEYVGEWKKGQAKRYDSLRLLIEWPRLQEAVPSLPPLKNSD
jgi:hypothetical protein